MPDITPLAAGHLLLISSRHYPCFGAWPEDQEAALRATRDRLRDLLTQTYSQPVWVIEHGPARLRAAGACIDHAHWHFLPVDLPLLQAVDERLQPGHLASLQNLRELYQSGQSYVYVERGPEEGYAYPVHALPCQFLRRVVTALQGHEGWSWQAGVHLTTTLTLRRQMIETLQPRFDALWNGR